MNDPIKTMVEAAGDTDVELTFGRVHIGKPAAERAIRAALRAAEEDGWVLVPLDPTSEMLDAEWHWGPRGLIDAGRLRLDESVKPGSAESVNGS